MENKKGREDEKKIKEEETNVKGVKIGKKRAFVSRKNFIFLFFIGLLAGIAIKGIVMRKYVIGFEDYKVKQLQSDYDLNSSGLEVSSEQDETVDEPAQEPLNCD